MSEQENAAVEPQIEFLTNEEALRLALEIIKRQDALLRKHGIDPREDPAT